MKLLQCNITSKCAFNGFILMEYWALADTWKVLSIPTSFPTLLQLCMPPHLFTPLKIITHILLHFRCHMVNFSLLSFWSTSYKDPIFEYSAPHFLKTCCIFHFRLGVSSSLEYIILVIQYFQFLAQYSPYICYTVTPTNRRAHRKWIPNFHKTSHVVWTHNLLLTITYEMIAYCSTHWFSSPYWKNSQE